jgi:hypothetical protein
MAQVCGRLIKYGDYAEEKNIPDFTGGFGDTQRAGGNGNFRGASYCALKIPKGLVKLLI